ncbi:MAG: hypothetical protein QGH45_22505 [Myxococcota bacterium]|nr:hypothetical protein [Myxococcota bacterium]
MAGAIGMFVALMGGSAFLAIRESMGDRRAAQRRLQAWATGRGLSGAGGLVSGTVDGCPVEIRMLIDDRCEIHARDPDLARVVHGHPGSAVRRGAVVLTVPGYDMSLIDRRIDLAVSLANALRAGCPDAVGD